MKFGEKLLFMCAIVSGYVILMFVIFYAMFRFSVHCQAFYSPVETQYRVEGQDSVRLIPKEVK